jgi:hypothetical protein
MLKIILFFLSFSLALFGKDPKTLVLIIANDDLPAFVELQKVWQSYMNSDPTHFDVFFLKGNASQETVIKIEGNTLFAQTEDNMKPGIYKKSIIALQEIALDDYDYILRTNLSSFFSFESLLTKIKTLPKTNCYAGVHLYLPQENLPHLGEIHFVSGAGILLSKDLAKLIAEKAKDFTHLEQELPDDVLMGYFFQKQGVKITSLSRVDLPNHAAWDAYVQNVGDFHFRAKSHYLERNQEHAFAEELSILNKLVSKFYLKEKNKDQKTCA